MLEQLRELGIAIAAGQIHAIRTETHAGFHEEKAAILKTGLAASSRIAVDDTRARHQGHNSFCTALGNDLIAYLESTDSKDAAS